MLTQSEWKVASQLILKKSINEFELYGSKLPQKQLILDYLISNIYQKGMLKNPPTYIADK